jgi:hypothetical protein
MVVNTVREINKNMATDSQRKQTAKAPVAGILIATFYLSCFLGIKLKIPEDIRKQLSVKLENSN